MTRSPTDSGHHVGVVAAIALTAALLSLPTRGVSAQPSNPKLYCDIFTGRCVAMQASLVRTGPGAANIELFMKIPPHSGVSPFGIETFWFSMIHDETCVSFEDFQGRCAGNNFLVDGTGEWDVSAVGGSLDRGRVSFEEEGSGRHVFGPPLPLALGHDYQGNSLGGWDDIYFDGVGMPSVLADCHRGLDVDMGDGEPFPIWRSQFVWRSCDAEGFGGWLRLAIPIRAHHQGRPLEPEEMNFDWGFVTQYPYFDGPADGSGCSFQFSDGELNTSPSCTESDFTPASVPEPATLVLLGSGLAGIGAAARRHGSRRRQRD